MSNSEEFLKKDSLIKKYSNKPLPKFLIFIGNIKTFDEYEDWIKEQNRTILKWIGTYLIILPFFCLTALNFLIIPNVLKNFFLAEGISISWYLLISLIKDIRGAIKNG